MGNTRITMLKIIKIEPTLFFVKNNNTLMQAIDVTIDNNSQTVEASIIAKFNSQELITNIGMIEKNGTYRFFMPDIREPISVEFSLKVKDEIQDSINIDWTPRKHWEIFMIPISHHDLGYTDTIERVLRKYCEIYEDVLRFCEETDNWSEESNFRYMTEESWS